MQELYDNLIPNLRFLEWNSAEVDERAEEEVPFGGRCDGL